MAIFVENAVYDVQKVASSSRLISGAGNGLNNVHKRHIALYRPTHMPWTRYELTSQPELAKECEECVVAACANGQDEEAKMHFHRYRSIGVMPTTNTWRKFLLMAYKTGDYHEIQSLFHTLTTFGVQPDVTSWNFLLDILSKRGLVRKTEEIFWSAMQSLNGHVNEFTMRAFFNCLMQEKRYLRAMIAYNGLAEMGFSITAEERHTLEQFCKQHVADRPGGLEPLNVPEEDAEAVAHAFQLDRITFGTSHVLSCSDNLSSAGRNAVLTWYAKRATNISEAEAFKIVLDTARFAWDANVSATLGLDNLNLSVMRGWLNSGDLSKPLVVDATTAEVLAQHTANSPYSLGSYSFEDGASRVLVVSKTNTGFQRHILSLDGKPVSAEDAAACLSYLKGVKPLDLIRSTL